MIARTLALDYEAEGSLGEHRHDDWAQLIYANRGVLEVATEDGRWVVPPQRAAWVPAGVRHEARFSRPIALRTVYFPSAMVQGQPQRCRVISVSALLRELVLEALRLGVLEREVPRHERLVGVLLDQLEVATSDPLELRLPRDRRALRVANELRAAPDTARTLEELCAGSGASKRTIERIFTRETGASLGRWRQQLRLMHAVRRLEAGESVTQVALNVGYESTSAFVSMFRRALGTSPGRYARSKPAAP